MDEMLDIYDVDGRHLGVRERAAIHRDGDWHRVFHSWVARRDDQGRDWLLFQRRGARKPTFPLYLAVTVGGHYRAGENVEDGLREVREELGLELEFDELVPCGRRRIEARWQNLVDREIADTFVYVSERPLASYPVMRPEVADLVAVPVAAGLALFAGQQDHVQAYTSDGPCTITLADFVPHHEEQFTNALQLARLVLNGVHNPVVDQEIQR